MLYSAKSLFKFSLLIGCLFSICFLSSCRDDDDSMGLPLTYDAAKHIYGTTSIPFSPGGKWEIIIDPLTGAYDSIPGTKTTGSISSPSGTKNLIDFESNKRIFWDDSDNHLVVQDLETLENTTIEIKDPITSTSVINPQFFTLGASNDIIYVFDIVGTLWLVDLSVSTVEILYSNLSFDDHVMDNQLYLESTNQLVYGGHIGASNVYLSTAVFTLNLDTGEIISMGDITPSFGWVIHPQDESIYGLTSPTDDQGFRLMQLRFTANSLQTQVLSQGDLSIDELSFHAQTIHSATNTYICRGGSTTEGMLENNIYSIDLSSGELNKTISINENQLIRSLNGE